MKSLETEYGVSQILQDIDYNRSMLLVKLNSLINEIELNKGKMTPETFGDNILLLNAIRNIQSQIIQLQKIFRDYLTEENPDKFYEIEDEYHNLLIRGEQGAELIDSQIKNLQVRDRSFRRYWNLWRDLVIADEGIFSKYREQIQAEDNAKELVNRFDNEIEAAIVALEYISLYAENISNRADEQQIVVRAPFTLYLTIVISLFIICFLGIIVSQYVTSSAKHIEHTMKKLEQSKDQLSKLTGYLLEIREEERSIISREIHDELGQSLTAIQIDATLINLELPENADYLHKKVKSMIELIQTTITSVQKISGKLRPAMLDQLGLESAFHWYIGEFQNRTGISCQVDFNYHDITEDKKIPITLYRILQESLTNIARHAKASEVIISLKDVKDHIELIVRDNGRGITDEQIKDSQSFGLRGMEERIRQLHGDFSIKGSSGQGTIVTVTIPLGGETGK